jgi:hypothetical protein
MISSSTLNDLAGAARQAHPCWDAGRADRVLATTLACSEKRIARAKFVRRSLVAVSAAGAMVLAVLRGATAPTASEVAPSSAHEVVAAHEAIHHAGDGGYGRD